MYTLIMFYVLSTGRGGHAIARYESIGHALLGLELSREEIERGLLLDSILLGPDGQEVAV